jgi:hypothetical protein
MGMALFVLLNITVPVGKMKENAYLVRLLLLLFTYRL